MAVDATRAGLVRKQVRERVRQMARERDEAVVGAGVDRDGDRPETAHEAVHVAKAGRVGVGDGGQEPGRTHEQVRARVRRPARLEPAHGMTADEPRPLGGGHRSDDGRLGRADVGHGRARGRRERGRHGRRELRDRCTHRHQIGAVERRGEVAVGLLDAAAIERSVARECVGIMPDDR